MDSVTSPELKPKPMMATNHQTHDYVLKFLLVGDSDAGKEEILNSLQTASHENEEQHTDSLTYRSPDVRYKSTNLLINGKRVKLHIWNASGQQFSTVFRSYSRGTQGIVLVYDISNKWSFMGLQQWLLSIDQYAPGVPKILVGNRQELAFRRQVDEKDARAYAAKHNMIYSEMSPLCNFNIQETFAELGRLVLERNGLNSFCGDISEITLQDLCYRTIVKHTTPDRVDSLCLPPSIKSYLLSFSSTLKSSDLLTNQIAELKKKHKRTRPSRPFSFKRLNPFHRRSSLQQSSSDFRHKVKPVVPPTRPRSNEHSCTIS